MIRRLEESPRFRRYLEPLREAAAAGKAALLRCDLGAFGEAMAANTRAQQKLHPELVGDRARQVIALAREHGVSGYKVNGAGGAGGSVTLLLARCERLRSLRYRGAILISAPPHPLGPHGLRRWRRLT